MGSHRFEIDQPKILLSCVTKKVKLTIAVKLKDVQRRKISFLFFANVWILTHRIDRKINVCGRIVMQLLILAGKAPGLHDVPHY